MSSSTRLDLVKPSKSIKNLQKILASSAQVDSALANIALVADPECPSTIHHIMTLVENCDTPPPTGAAKKQLVLQKFAALFPAANNEHDLRIAGKIIDYLCEQNLVQRVSAAAVVGASVCTYLQKKLC